MEEITTWQKTVESKTFSEKFHETVRKMDLYVFLNGYNFNGVVSPDTEINANLSSLGPSIDMLFKNLLNPLDLYFYGGFGFTQDATFVETNTLYPVQDNYLWGLGIYLFQDFPKVSPYAAFELQAQSFLGVNNNLDYTTTNFLTELQGEQISSLNFTIGVDIPFHLFEKIGYCRAYISPAIFANTELDDGSYSENVSEIQWGLEFQYRFYKSMLLNLGYRGGVFQGVNRENYNLLSLNLGFRF